MGKPHTIIGAERFHFRVRDGIGWFTLAIAARQTGLKRGQIYFSYSFSETDKQYKKNKSVPFSESERCIARVVAFDHTQNAWVLYGQASRAISTG
jgi:hypothetical protein